jgi:uncharacterized RDD family membrane protein YckC
VAEHELSAIPRQARAFQGQRAGVVTRVVAAGFDIALVALTLVSTYVGFAGARFLIDPRGFSWPNPSFLSFLGFMGVLMVLYLTVAWSLGGRTFGNMLMGLRVVSAGGARIGWFRASARAVAYVVLPIGLLWSALDRRSRSVQDLVLWTTVVYDWRPRSGRASRAAVGSPQQAGP